MGRIIAVLDVGGTSMKTGVVDLGHLASSSDGEPPARVELGPAMPANSQGSADEVLDTLAAAADAALGLAGPGVTGLAIAFCGPFDIEAGISRMKGVHKFESIFGIDLRSELRLRSTVAQRPIRFARDAEAAGTGEALAGAGRGFDRVLTITVGTGLGTCLTDHTTPVEIVDGFGVEHLAMRTTSTGARADNELSARGLAQRLGVDTVDLRAAVDDPANADAVSDHGTRLGAFLAPVVHEFDAHIVVIGGGFAAAFERFGPALQSSIGSVLVRPARLGTAGPLLGAAKLTFAARNAANPER